MKQLKTRINLLYSCGIDSTATVNAYILRLLYFRQRLHPVIFALVSCLTIPLSYANDLTHTNNSINRPAIRSLNNVENTILQPSQAPNHNTAPDNSTQSDANSENDELRLFLKQTISNADSFEDRFDAEVWLVDMSGRLKSFMKSPQERLELLRAVHREATLSQLKPDLVLALIEVESRFDSYAVSRAGAQGLMQVMPFWKNEIGRPGDNLINAKTNLSYGCRILQFYLKKEQGNWMKALARYNGSYGKYWYSERVMDAWRKRWFVNEQ